MILTRNLSFHYGQRAVLSGISFEQPRGTILGILGPNGAGKSTLLKLLNRRLKPTDGTVAIHDRNLADFNIQELAQITATVHQTTRIAFGFTVEELVSMGRRPYLGSFDHLSRTDRQHIDKAIESVGLQELRTRPITHLSGGELQLAFVAKALAQTPQLLLMDEATSSLDIHHTSQILRLIRQQVQTHNLTVAAVIHDINLAASFCDQILFLSDGILRGPSAPEKLITEETLCQVYGIEPERITIHTAPQYLECRLS